MTSPTSIALAIIVLSGCIAGTTRAGVYQLVNIDEMFGLIAPLQGSVDEEGNVSGYYSRVEAGQSVSSIVQQIPGTATARFFEPEDLGVDFFRGHVGGDRVGEFAFGGRTPQPGDGEAFTYRSGVGIAEIGALAEFGTEISAMNARGQVTGGSYLGDDERSRAYLYTPGQALLDLGTLGGNDSRGWGVNDLGHVVGDSEVEFAYTFDAPFVWTPEGGMQLITDVPGNRFRGTAHDINESGWVAGEIRGDIFIRTAGGDFVPDVGEYFLEGENFSRTVGGQALKMLEKDFAAYGNSTVQDGQNFSTEPWLWTEAGGTEFFDEFELLGYGGDDWDFGGFQDANELGWILASANYTPTGEGFSVLLKPVPEPSVAVLIALTLAAGSAVRRRRCPPR